MKGQLSFFGTDFAGTGSHESGHAMESLTEATACVVSLSGGKDSMATLLWVLEQGLDLPILAHHQAMPEDWDETIPYIRDICRRFGVLLVVEQAVYRSELRTFKNGRLPEMQRKLYVLDLAGMDRPVSSCDGLCTLVDYALDRGWPPTQRNRWCTSQFKRELFDKWVRGEGLAGMLDYAQSRGAPPTNRYRWCTGKYKVKLFEDSIRRNREMLGDRPVVLFGYRRAESPRRARKEPWVERDAVSLKPSQEWPRGWQMWEHAPILDWSRRSTFRKMRDHGIEPHPCYALQGMTAQDMYDLDHEGGPRCSCRNCIFAGKQQVKLTAECPENWDVFARTLEFERQTGLSWWQSWRLTDLLAETQGKLETGTDLFPM